MTEQDVQRISRKTWRGIAAASLLSLPLWACLGFALVTRSFWTPFGCLLLSEAMLLKLFL